MKNFEATIYHNPKCGTSRNVLAMIRASGVEPTVVEYVQGGWEKKQLEALIAAMGVSAKDIMRVKGTPCLELGLDKPGVTDAQVIAAMVAHPILVERPIVVTPKGAKVCRPSEVVFTLLENVPKLFTKEDGEVVSIKPV